MTDTTNPSTTGEADRAAALRNELVDAVAADRASYGIPVPPAVAAAMRTVPRHLFTPGLSLDDAYADRSVLTKHDERGAAISSVSEPRVIATMLTQLDVRPGQRVLEIGTGGYNAALLRELVGPTGRVTSVDLDPEIVARAGRCLATAGYDDVRVRCADGEHGAPDAAPFDRIIVTVGAWDIPPAWIDQLAPGGRLVVPLRMRDLTRSVVFEREGDHLVDRGYQLCGFVAIQGIGVHEERLILLDGPHVGLRIDGEADVEPRLLRAALGGIRVEHGSGVFFGPDEPLDVLNFWLAARVDRLAVLIAKPEPISAGRVPRSARTGAWTMFTRDSFACRWSRALDEERTRFEFALHGYGPDGPRLVEEYAEILREWDREYRGGPPARIQVHSAAAPIVAPTGGRVLPKRHTQVVVFWPSARAAAIPREGVLS